MPELGQSALPGHATPGPDLGQLSDVCWVSSMGICLMVRGMHEGMIDPEEDHDVLNSDNLEKGDTSPWSLNRTSTYFGK